MRCGRAGERQRHFEFILRGRDYILHSYERSKNTHEAGRVEYGALAGVENWIVCGYDTSGIKGLPLALSSFDEVGIACLP